VIELKDKSIEQCLNEPLDYMENMDVVIVGHVDHGKSTILGRLLADTGSLPEGKLEQVRERCRRNSKPFEYAFLSDALKDEQSQGITIDSARCFLKTGNRKYIIIDAPGHIEFLKNMVTGASRADTALLVVAADEGIRENSRRHGFMLSMLGIKQVAVLINKMDLAGYDENVYRNIINEYGEFLAKIDIFPSFYIPVSGMCGDNIIKPSERMLWYDGNTVLEALNAFKVEKLPENKPFRMPVQDVYKFTAERDVRRIVAGTIVSGRVNVGDEVVFYPSGKKSRVNTIEAFRKERQLSAGPGIASGFTLTEQIYVKQGEMAALNVQSKPRVSARIKVSLFWLGKQPMEMNKDYLIKLGTAKTGVRIEEIHRIIDASNLESGTKDKIERNDVADCILKLDREIAFDLSSEIAETSRFVIVDGYEIAGGGIIQETLSNITWQSGKVSYEDRCRNINQKGMVIWFTGLSGSGKSTIAIELEKELVQRRKIVYRLDGDNIRQGLNSDLGFSEEDRNENIRRIAEVAALFKDAGVITLVSFISPYRKMREFARKRSGREGFYEVYVKADIETCSHRDPKGLYEKAKKGEICNFTGVSSVYETPDNPELVLDTTVLSVEESVNNVMTLILQYYTIGRETYDNQGGNSRSRQHRKHSRGGLQGKPQM